MSIFFEGTGDNIGFGEMATRKLGEYQYSVIDQTVMTAPL